MTDVKLPERKTTMTREQREAVDRARRLLAPHFAGETVSLYCPRQFIEQKLAREQRIRAGLAAGLSVALVAQREGVSDRYVRSIRGRIRPGAEDGG